MASKEVITLVCDICNTDDLVSTHSMMVDGKAIEFELCDQDWLGIVAGFARLSEVGRKPARPVKVSARKDIMPFPGESWDFTAHALRRLGERHISPREACAAADNPDMTHGARTPDMQVRERGGVKVVVDPERQLIVTASRREEDEENVA